MQRLDGKPLIGVKPLAELLATTSADGLKQASILVNEERRSQPRQPAHDQHAEPAARALEPQVPASLRHESQRTIESSQPRHRRNGARRDRRDPDCLQRRPPDEDPRAGVDRLGLGCRVARREFEMRVPGDNRNPTWLRVDFAQDRGPADHGAGGDA